MSIFSGFSAQDFAAYSPEKWQSNVYNLERMRVKDKLVALGDALSPLMPAPEAAPLDFEVSVEHPALWNGNAVSNQLLYFTRSEDERQELFSRNTKAKSMAALLADPAPQREHIYLGVELDAKGISVSLTLCPEAAVDRENIAEKLGDLFRLQSLAEQFGGLPETFDVIIENEAARPARELDAEGLKALLPQLSGSQGMPASLLEAPPALLTICRHYDAEATELVEPGLVDLLRADLDALLPVYHQLAWGRQNDHLEVKQAIREEKKVKKARGLEVGDTIRVLRGLFTSKVGEVMDIDAKGQLKVRLGTMVVKIDAKDVTHKG